MNIVILAAGMGRRMKSSLPKVLHQICSRPMICHVLDAIATFKESNIVVVVALAVPTSMIIKLTKVINVLIYARCYLKTKGFQQKKFKNFFSNIIKTPYLWSKRGMTSITLSFPETLNFRE